MKRQVWPVLSGISVHSDSKCGSEIEAKDKVPVCCKVVICICSFCPGHELSSRLWDSKERAWERISSCCTWSQEMIHFAVFSLFCQSPSFFLTYIVQWFLTSVSYPHYSSDILFPITIHLPFLLLSFLPFFLSFSSSAFPSCTFFRFPSVSTNGIHGTWFRTSLVATWISPLVSIYRISTKSKNKHFWSTVHLF